MKDYQKAYQKNMTDEKIQKHKEAKNKRSRDKYNNMTDEEKQKYRKKYENMTNEQKQKTRDYQKQYKENIT